MAKLPAAVARQAEEADAAINTKADAKTAAKATPIDPSSVPEPSPEGAAIDPASVPVKPEGEENPPAGEKETPQQPDKKDDPAYWQNRTKSLEGMYNQEVEKAKQMQTQVQQLETRVSQLTELLGNLRQGGQQPGQQGHPVTQQDLKPLDLSDLKIEDYDDLDPRAKRLAEVVKSQADYINKLLQNFQGIGREVRTIKDGLGNVYQSQTQNATERAREHLDTNLPNWTEIDKDPVFQNWLRNKRVFGRPVAMDYRAATENPNGEALLEIYNTYIREMGGPAGGGGGSGALNTPSLNRQITPEGATGAANTPAAKEQPRKRVYGLMEIEQFYNDANRGKYSDDDYKRIEADIFAAQNEGRIDHTR